MRGFIVSPLAAADLEEIVEYYLQVRPEYVGLLQDKFLAQFRLVGRNPRLGSDCSRLSLGLRRTVVLGYAIYHTTVGGRTVIVRIRHGARDIDASLFDGSNP